MIKWRRLSKKDRAIIDLIIDRLISLGQKDSVPIDRLSAMMDVSAAHLANPLRLDELLKADEFNFKHDVYGIMNHIDRNTGKLKDFFSPRYSAGVVK